MKILFSELAKLHEMGTDLFLLREERWCARRNLPPTIRFLDDLIVKWWRAGRMRKRGSMSFRCLGFCRVRRAHHGRPPTSPAGGDFDVFGRCPGGTVVAVVGIAGRGVTLPRSRRVERFFSPTVRVCGTRSVLEGPASARTRTPKTQCQQVEGDDGRCGG